MPYEKPKVDDEDIGIRAMHVRRDKAVERAMQLLRHGMGPSANELTAEQVAELQFAFGEVYSFVPRLEWDRLRFANLTHAEIVRICELARELRAGAHNETAVLQEIEGYLHEREAHQPWDDDL